MPTFLLKLIERSWQEQLLEVKSWWEGKCEAISDFGGLSDKCCLKKDEHKQVERGAGEPIYLGSILSNLAFD